jgi:hypothetical protein
MADTETILYTTKFGTYYNPATKHYNNPSNNVICDNCHKERLTSCIAHHNCDLCLPCVEEINRNPNYAGIFGKYVKKEEIPSYPGTMPEGAMCFAGAYYHPGK